MTRFTNIIIGGGTAGCLLANRLASDPTRRVLLVEGGGTNGYYPWFHVPIGYLYCIGNPRADWMYRTAPCDGLHGRSLLYPRGKVLGGCSAINGMIYMRGQSDDYNQWAAAVKDKTWSWDEMLPLFKRHECHHAGATEFHGGNGELHVSKQRLNWDLLDRFQDSVQEAGIPLSTDFNEGNNNGVGYFEVTQRRGLRWSSRSAFIPKNFIRSHSNLVVKCNRTADHLVYYPSFHNRVAGIRLVDSDRAIASAETSEEILLDSSDSRSEVILCAGAIGTPAILLRSGIGPEKELERLRMQSGSHNAHFQSRAIIPGVGQNLQDHLQIRTVFEISGLNSLNSIARQPFRAISAGLEYMVKQTGPLSMAPSQLGLFTNTSSSNKASPNVEFHVQPLSLDAFGSPLHNFPAITVSVCNLNPTSRGSVTLPSLSPHDAPIIQPNYLSTDEDRLVSAESILLARRLARETSFGRHVTREHFPGEEYRSSLGVEELAKAAGRIGTTIFHPSGTCKLGSDEDPTSVVDSQLRLRGIEGVRIADASVMPTITSGNTNAPTLVIAEKLAHMIKTTQ
ncbi:choline dehydrogenase lipoprotein oxidoreductase, putative [Bodo saltans]|uniref:Choline dehydrogenase lipoprotein oxidoreductase, putative n=1 Tax=Bodo saltans TaxID=75058 RepID=A0A0S4JRE2_BODSA|nr:choline dehydrogenase lipoprotein oxidoreductase, putative [Bodo saltans]|eukprot:CUG91647.1 choline dehydrogenase lipoprotein oxidoreductase, putative [Bodo saltans]